MGMSISALHVASVVIASNRESGGRGTCAKPFPVSIPSTDRPRYSGPRPTNAKSYNDWTTKRVPLTQNVTTAPRHVVFIRP